MARPYGSKNHILYDTKTSIQSVYNALGGAEGMLEWAKDNKTEYYRMLVQVLPKEQRIEFANPLNTVTADDIARLIQSFARARGIAVPSSVERIIDQETRDIQALPKASTIP